jgi:Flp pilus assembly protein TadD
LRERTGGHDSSLLADLAFVRLREGRRVEARRLAEDAARLQPAASHVRTIVRLTAPPAN